MRRAALCLTVVLAVAISGCSDNPQAVKQAPRNSSRSVTPVTLDQGVMDILSLYPKGLETAATTRWTNVKSKYTEGLSDPSQMVVAKQMLFDLSDWIIKKTPEMDTPPNAETKSAASSRAVLYMSMYVYGGPLTAPPSLLPSGDAAVGVVTPTAAATIVTPTRHAGVQLEAGSVEENTIVVVTQNPTHFDDNCSGPLQTKLCQYPQFYTFEQFPHKALLKPAKFNVCHVNTGSGREPLVDHDRLRLAHTKPANAADYTTGSTIRDQNGENIEILPLVSQTFSTCTNTEYPVGTVVGSTGNLLSRFAQGMRKIFSPKTAYAIDLGLGGLSRSFSAFNDVDSLSRPDVVVQSLSVTPNSLRPGDHVTLSYSVSNTGTATRGGVQAAVLISSPGFTEGPPLSRQIGSVTLGAIPPGRALSETALDVVIPQDLPVGSYSLQLAVPSETDFPDTEPANNQLGQPLTVGEVWTVQESGGWHAVWTRNAAGGFDGAWESDDFEGHEFFPMAYTRNGDSVDLVRTQGNACHYVGTIAQDGIHASGTEVCPGNPNVYTWTATITGPPPVIQ